MKSILNSAAGSTSRLIFYTLSYFTLYAIFGVCVKYAQGTVENGFLGMKEVDFLIYSTSGSALLCLGVIVFGGWWKAAYQGRELIFMVASGVFTALVIPTTTLMYSLPISVMVAMVIMRGSIIVVTRMVDSILLWQGLSNKKVRWEENLAVALSLTGVGVSLLNAEGTDFNFYQSSAAMGILTVYILAYSLRLYLMNYFKFTRTGTSRANNKNYFAIEQLSASVWIFGFIALLLFSPSLAAKLFPFSSETNPLAGFAFALQNPPDTWMWAFVFGLPFGLSAFFSVFLFMFEGRTSTFSGLVNRLASLLAGTASTLLFAVFFAGKWPKFTDWISLGIILGAVYCLSVAERKRNS